MRRISYKDLHPGDILLCKGKTFWSNLIVKLDGGRFSHVAIYDGKHVIESMPRTVEDDDELPGSQVNDLITLHERYHPVHVYRFRKNGSWLGSGDYPAEPVIERAQTYMGLGYSYYQVMFIAYLVAVKELPVDTIEGRLLRTLLESAVSMVEKVIERNGETMVCSEFVYRCFKDASVDGRYRLKFPRTSYDGLLPFIADTEGDAVAAMEAKEDDHEVHIKHQTNQFYASWSKMRMRPPGDAPVDPRETLTIASCLTPLDFEESNTLIEIGRLDFDRFIY